MPRDYRTAVYALLRKCAERCAVHFLYTAVGNNTVLGGAVQGNGTSSGGKFTSSFAAAARPARRTFGSNKSSAQVWVEQITGRLRQYANELPTTKMLTIDEFAERVALCFLRELRDAAWLAEPPDTQLVIATAMGMTHACMQTIATENPRFPLPITKEMVN